MFIATNAIAATQFRSDREEAGLPVATDAQLKRAQQLTESNPMYRSYRTPLGLQQLALMLPLTRRERIANRIAVSVDPETGVEQKFEGIVLKPTQVRTGDEAEVTASAEAVEAFVGANPHFGPLEAAQEIGRLHGYYDLAPAIKRAERFGRSTKVTRVVGHIRNKLLCLSAMAQAIKLCEARDEAEAATAT